jgi:predicted RNA-binding protein with RPS1 domain
MEFEVNECPNCRGAIRLKPGATETTCTYCGAELHRKEDADQSVASSNNILAEQLSIHKQTGRKGPEVGQYYSGVVKRVVDFGAFIEIIPGTDGLLHISEIADERISRVTDVLNEGDEVVVKCINVDSDGKIRLSRREALRDEPTDINPHLGGEPQLVTLIPIGTPLPHKMKVQLAAVADQQDSHTFNIVAGTTPNNCRPLTVCTLQLETPRNKTDATANLIVTVDDRGLATIVIVEIGTANCARFTDLRLGVR